MKPFTDRETLNLSGFPTSHPIAGMNPISGVSMWNLSHDASYVKRTMVSTVLCAASRTLARAARWHARRVTVRKTKRELEALPYTILKDIGVKPGDIDNLAEDLASRVQPCR